jgi:hypothetical protein
VRAEEVFDLDTVRKYMARRLKPPDEQEK